MDCNITRCGNNDINGIEQFEADESNRRCNLIERKTQKLLSDYTDSNFLMV